MRSLSYKKLGGATIFALAVLGVGFSANLFIQETKKENFNREYDTLSSEFFEKRDVVFSKFEINQPSKQQSQCVESFNAAQVKILQAYLNRIESVFADGTLETHINDAKPLISKFEHDCKPFL